MAQPGTASFSVYGLMAVVGAAAAGCVMVVIRLLSRTESTNTILVYQALGVGFVMIIPAWMYCRYGEASMLASLDYVRLVYATIFGAWIFHQWPGVETLAGAFIIVCASLYTVHREAKRRTVLVSAAESRPNQNN